MNAQKRKPSEWARRILDELESDPYSDASWRIILVVYVSLFALATVGYVAMGLLLSGIAKVLS